jgi:hypothetical protein
VFAGTPSPPPSVNHVLVPDLNSILINLLINSQLTKNSILMCDHRQRVCGCPDGLLIHCDPVGSLHLERGRTARLLQDLAYRRSVCSSSTCSQARSVYKIRLALLILSLFRTISLTWVLCLPTVGTAHTMESGTLSMVIFFATVPFSIVSLLSHLSVSHLSSLLY